MLGNDCKHERRESEVLKTTEKDLNTSVCIYAKKRGKMNQQIECQLMKLLFVNYNDNNNGTLKVTTV